MSKTEKVKEFNQILETFLHQLSPIIGTSYHYYYKQVVKVNAVEPIKTFLLEVVPFKKKIFEKDESYFYNLEENEKEKIGDDEETLTELLRLKDIYGKLDEKSKSEVWSYFQALILLSEEYSTIN